MSTTATPRDSLDLRAPLGRFDAAVEEAFDPARQHSGLHTTAAVVSNLADYGAAWVLLAAWKGRHRGRARRRAVAGLAVAGVSSYLVNAFVKRLVRRERPARRAAHAASRRLPVRTPTSPSFPSGHTLAATCTAVTLAGSPVEEVALLGLATAVGASRLHLGDHHGSDVVGGWVIGALLGALCRPLVHPVSRLVPSWVAEWPRGGRG